MVSMAKLVMRRFYRQAQGDPTRLPWHRDEPDAMLRAAVDALGGTGCALDVGCGSGEFAIWLAQQGMTVTGIDVIPEAIPMARALAENNDASVELITTDLFTYEPDKPFHLVHDSGCLHSLIGGDTRAYKRQLLTWLAPGGYFVLGHWGKLHPWDWRPIGPRRRSQKTIEQLFAPELELLDTEVVDGDVPLPFGPKVRAVGYRFQMLTS